MEAVVSASQGALGPLLGKLNALLAHECSRLKGVDREIHSLRSELSSMHAALQKYTMLEDPDVQVKTWISVVRELAYDIEDCIDKFIHDLGNDGHHGGIKEFFRRLKTLGSRRQIANQIDALKARVIEVKDQRTSYKLDDIACSTFSHPRVDPRLSALFAEEKQLVGIDGPRDDLAKWMVQEGEHRRVLSIVGFGGLGKTTLANEVYRTIQGQFHCHALVSVSQQPVLRKIIKDVISQVACDDGFTKDIDLWDEKKSIAKLREVLQDKRFLVIIDDIWSISAWDAIKCAFPDNNCSSRIIATTRIFDVASSCCSGGDDRIYEMEPLNDVHSKRLFYKRIFGSDCCPDMLKEISIEILKKCGGLPLAIISISALLANRPVVKQEWEKVKRSIGCALDKKQSLEGMKSILFLGYSDLPHNLKTCLLYLSTFPEDYEIERESLVWRWIAEGFISEERGQNQEEVAESYFYDLINKSMVQPVDIGYHGKARACRVHDMMLELIISKAIEENFVTVLSGQTVLPKTHGSIRRLSIQYSDQQLAAVLANTDLRHARSLSCFGSIKWMPRLVQFEALRVLDFGSCDDFEEYDLQSIDKLFHLKYLSLGYTERSNLQAGIVKLQYLETLDLRGSNVVELPTGFFRLTKLLRLLGNSRMKIPDGIGNMTNLQVLLGIDIYHSSTAAVEELGKLTCLRELGINMEKTCADTSNYKSHDDMLFAALCKLASGKLQSLSIHQYDGNFLQSLYHWSPPPRSLQRFYMNTDYDFPSTPKWIQPVLTSLVYLDINLRELTEEDLHTLGELPALLFLELWSEADPKERLTVQPIGFPGLKEFVLVCSRRHGGAYLTFVEGAMPKLVKLELPFHVSMAKPHGFYLGIRHLPCLKEAVVRLHKEGAEYPDSKAAAVAIRNEANGHPNRPRVTIIGKGVDEDKEESHTNEEVSEEESDYPLLSVITGVLSEFM